LELRARVVNMLAVPAANGHPAADVLLSACRSVGDI
jgi:hypothetical protein